MDSPVNDASITAAPSTPAPRPNRRARRESERLKRLDRLAEMGTVAAGLAHELKNPLSTMKLNLQLMEEDLANLPGAQRSLLRVETLKKEADRLRQTLDDFLKYAGRMELRLEKVTLNSLVEHLVDFIHPQAQASKVRLMVSLVPENPECMLDPNLIKQALLNLLLNAIQAMPQGGDLVVRTLIEKGTTILYVSDTGTGIKKENLPRIFDAYFTTKRGGTGLGLPTTRRIIEEHHGNISVSSEPGKGTTFRIDLPMSCEMPDGETASTPSIETQDN